MRVSRKAFGSAAHAIAVASHVVALAAAAAACAPEAEGERSPVVFDDYTGGDAFPNRRPRLDTTGTGIGLTSDNGSDTVSVVDLSAGRVVASVPVGRDPIDRDGPHHLAADARAGAVYVALAYPPPETPPGPHAAHGSSARPGVVRKLALDDLRPLGEVWVDANPGDVVLSADGSRLVTAHFDLTRALARGTTLDEKRANLVVVDVAEFGEALPEARRIPVCVAPHGVALVGPSGGTALVACYGEDSIAVVDLDRDEAPIVRVPVGLGPGSPGAPRFGPYSATLAPSGATLAVGNTEARDVRFLDVGSLAMAPFAVKTAGAPYFAAWSPEGDLLVVPTQGPDELVLARAATGEVVTRRALDPEVCRKPHEVVWKAAVAYVVCEGDHAGPGTVVPFDPETLATSEPIPVGVYPDRLVFAGSAP